MTGESPLRVALVSVVAGLFGWMVGLVFPLIGPEFAAIVAAIAALGAEVAHRLTERGITGPNIRLAELGAAFLVAKTVHLVLLGPDLMAELAAFPAGLADTETILGFLLMWVVRSSAHRTIRDIRLLGSPGDEALGTAYDRLAKRFRFVLGLSTLLGAFAVAGWQQLAILDRLAFDGLVWPLALMVIIGIGSLGAFRRIEDAGRWRRAGARVDDQVWLRWGSGVIVLTAAAGLMVILFRAGVDEYARIPVVVVRGLAAAGAAIVGWLRPGDIDPVETSEIVPFQDDTTSDSQDGFFDFLRTDDGLSEPSAWEMAVVSLAWFVAAVGFVALMVTILRNRKWIRSAFAIGPGEGMRTLLVEFVRMLREIVSLLWQMLTFWRRRHPDEAEADDLDHDPSAGGGASPGPWAPGDPGRSRIAAAYHRFLASAGRLLPRHRTETPDEYARAISGQLPFGSREAAQLTDLYVEARYSEHTMAEGDSEAAERLADELGQVIDQQPS